MLNAHLESARDFVERCAKGTGADPSALCHRLGSVHDGEWSVPPVPGERCLVYSMSLMRLVPCLWWNISCDTGVVK